MNDLKDGLERIAATTGPDPVVDVVAAVVRGRRIRRARRAAATAVVAAGIAVVVSVAALHGGERETNVAGAAAYPNPLYELAAFGWLPEGYKQARAGRDNQGRAAYSLAAGRAGEDGNEGLVLTVYGPGPEPGVARLPGGGEGRRTPAPPVNGRPAYWTIKPSGAGSGQVAAEFRWEYRPRSWALLSITDPAVADVATVQRIATATRFGGGRPTAFPMRVTGVPGGFKIMKSALGRGPEARFVLSATGSTDGSDDLSIELTPSGGPGGAASNTTIDGHRAYSDLSVTITDKGEGPATETLRIFDLGGFDLTLSASGEPLRRLRPSGGLVGLYRRTAVLGSDPSRWTVTPLS
ncbi:hypothetical protein [Actinomadura rubrisoli]|uniref:Uncharacterized protein n=1 Tax=Actinomadura rubrisoli TaxID=2530368 RepID=A0A4R5C6V3_9ACTN|nr:hypothetical protein [Actinomadura rubrisoli]TDD95428.1 hypothetical protein E1298_04765 [Actinomadura rubrisoli]